MASRRNVKPEDDPRVVRLKKDQRAVLDCMSRVARGGKFDYCQLHEIGLVIARKERKKEDAKSKLQRLVRDRRVALEKSRELCVLPRWSGKFCDCDYCIETCVEVEYFDHEIKVHTIRIQLLRSLIARLQHVQNKRRQSVREPSNKGKRW